GIRDLIVTGVDVCSSDLEFALAFAKSRSENGPISPGRWQSTQRLRKIGSTSLWKVTVADADEATGAVSTRHPSARVAATGGSLPLGRASRRGAGQVAQAE